MAKCGKKPIPRLSRCSSRATEFPNLTVAHDDTTCRFHSLRAPCSRLLQQNLLECRGRLEEEHQHRAAIGRDRRVAASLGADDEVAGGAFALVIAQRAF